MWILGEVTMNFTGRLCGSVPLKKEIVESWLTARMPKEKPEDGKSLEEIKKEVLESTEDIEEKVTLGFQKNEKGLFVRGGTLKAHLKDCANQIKDIVNLTKAKKKEGESPNVSISNFRGKVANKFYIDEYYVHLTKGGNPAEIEDGQFDQPVHVITRQGPRNALKIIRFLNQPSLSFHFRLLKDKEITPEKIEKIFEYGTIHGYGGERGMGEGRYQFQIKWIEN